MKSNLPRGASGRPARQVAVAAAREAASVIRRQFGVAKTVGHKSRGNIVTEADLMAERAILAALRREFPDHGLLSEESPAVGGSGDYRWVIDPLDGTMNFSQGLQHFAVSIALTRDGEPVLGVVCDPMRRELFVAEQGRGVTLDGRHVQASECQDLDTATGGFDLGYDEEGRGRALAAASKLRPHIQTLRLMGSAVLGQAYVACGRFDLYFHNYLYPWDCAAGHLLLREAGATATDGEGGPVKIESQTIVAANPALHREFFAVMALGAPPAR